MATFHTFIQKIVKAFAGTALGKVLVPHGHNIDRIKFHRNVQRRGVDSGWPQDNLQRGFVARRSGRRNLSGEEVLNRSANRKTAALRRASPAEAKQLSAIMCLGVHLNEIHKTVSAERFDQLSGQT